MTKKGAAAAVAETNLYIRSHGGTEDQRRSGTEVAYEIQTDYGPAFVSVISPCGRGDMPWLALRYNDMARVSAAMDSHSLPRGDVNPYSGKFNCHILDENRTAREVADAFRQHLNRAGFPAREPIDEAPAGT